jgi:hypothetical protein
MTAEWFPIKGLRFCLIVGTRDVRTLNSGLSSVSSIGIDESMTAGELTLDLISWRKYKRKISALIGLRLTESERMIDALSLWNSRSVMRFLHVWQIAEFPWAYQEEEVTKWRSFDKTTVIDKTWIVNHRPWDSGNSLSGKLRFPSYIFNLTIPLTEFLSRRFRRSANVKSEFPVARRKWALVGNWWKMWFRVKRQWNGMTEWETNFRQTFENLCWVPC